LNLVKRVVGEDLNGKRIAALGLAFKPDVDDLRESPAIAVTKLLVKAGAMVRCYEPYKLDAEIPGVNSEAMVEDAIRDADVLMLLVGHRELLELNPAELRQLTPARWAIDTVGGWEKPAWINADFKIVRLGDGK
jgi:UDP-N-acetyl-D-mannosaminuronate dehydrogenase